MKGSSIELKMNILFFIGLITIGVVKGQDFGCPPTGIHSIAYPNSCIRFVQCINGNGIVRDCAPGLYFDIVRGQCNTQEQANCNPCRGNGADQVTFARDPFNCARFTMCIGTVHSENTCGQGLYFDITRSTCALSDSVDCSISVGPTTTTTTGSPGNPPGNPPPEDDPIGPGIEGSCDIDANFEIIASPLGCDRYTICTCGHANPRTCPPGLIFDVVTQSCNTPAQGQCLTDNLPPCPDGDVTITAHPADCRHLILCILGQSFLEPCAPGLEVNRRTNKCDFRHIAQCTSQTALTYTQLMSGMFF